MYDRPPKPTLSPCTSSYITRCYTYIVSIDDVEDAEEDALNAAAVEAQRQEEEYGDQQYYDEYGQPYQYDYSAAEQEGFGDYYNNASQQQQEQQDAYGQHQDPLAR